MAKISLVPGDGGGGILGWNCLTFTHEKLPLRALWIGEGVVGLDHRDDTSEARPVRPRGVPRRGRQNAIEVSGEHGDNCRVRCAKVGLGAGSAVRAGGQGGVRGCGGDAGKLKLGRGCCSGRTRNRRVGRTTWLRLT